MSSLRTVPSSKANGAPAVTPHSPENSIIHGLCADCIVLEDEERENFLNLLQQHVNHFRPVDEVEFGLVEEMCAARWRQRRAWSIETRMFENQIARPPDGDGLDRMVIAFDSMASAPPLSVLHRYETRLNLTYQRTLRTLIMLRTLKAPNDPSPISEHPEVSPNKTADVVPPAIQAADSEPLGQSASGAYRSPAAPFLARSSQPPSHHQDRPPGPATAAKPPDAHPVAPPFASQSRGAA
jgi:hypothetical protein